MDEMKVDPVAEDAPPHLAELSLSAIELLVVADLRRLCQAEGIEAGGRKADLVARLRAAKRGGGGGYVAGQTLCKYCGCRVTVRGTRVTTLDDGRVLVTRSVRCLGRRHHSYPVKELATGS